MFYNIHLKSFLKSLELNNFRFILVLSLYIAFIIFIININLYSLVKTFLVHPRSEYILEAVLQPKVDYPLDLIFNVDPLITTTTDQSINIIHKKINNLIFSSLFKIDFDNKIINDLVDKYHFIESHILEIEIKKDIFWHDYTNLTVDDVIFTFDLIRALGDKTAYIGAINGGDISLQKIDDFKLHIILSDNNNVPKPNSSYLAFLDFPILPKHILSNYSFNSLSNIPNTDFGKKPIGSGPFVYFNNKVSELQLIKFKSYKNNIFNFKQEANVNKYIIKLYPSLEKIIYDFKLKIIDIFIQNFVNSDTNVFFDELNFKNFNIFNEKFVLFFNLNRKENFFNNSALLRRALVKGLDRSWLSGNTGLDFTLSGPIYYESEYFLNSNFLVFNLDEYKSRLDSLGFKLQDDYFYKNNRVLSINLTYLDEGYSKLIVNSLSNYLNKLGIQVFLRPIQKYPIFDENGILKQSSFVDIVYNRDYDLLIIPIVNLIIPNLYDEWHSSRINPPGLNLANFVSKAADLYLEQSRISTGEEFKNAIFNFQKIFYEEMPAIYLTFTKVKVIYSDRINLTVNRDKIYDIFELYRLMEF